MLEKRLVVVVSVAGWLTGSLAVFAQSSQPPLAEIARKEAERRKAVAQTSKVYTNEDTKSGGRLLTTAAAKTAEGGTSESGDAAAGSKDDPKVVAVASEVNSLRASELRNQAAAKEQAAGRMRLVISQYEALITGAFDQAQRESLTAERDSRVAALQQLESEIASLVQQASDLQNAPRPAPPQPGPGGEKPAPPPQQQNP